MDSVYIYNNDFKSNNSAIAFDFDDTLISKSNCALPFVFQKLNECIKNNICIVIFSNQKNITISNIQNRINIFKSLFNIPFIAYFSRNDDSFRKPQIGMYNSFIIEYPECTILKYIGDASGRIGDFSDSDLQFANNCKIKFETTESFFSFESKIHIELKEDFEFLELIQKPCTAIFLIGYPASGKSTFALQLYNKYNYKIINNDTMKTKSISYAKKYIQLNNNIVIDNLNYTESSRSKFLELLNFNYTKIFIYFSKSYNYCKIMNSNREKKIPDVVFNSFRKNFEVPKSDKSCESDKSDKSDESCEYNYAFTIL